MRYSIQMLVAVAGVVAATALRWAIDDLMPAGFPFLTYFPVVVLSAYVFGLLAGIVSAVLSTAAAYVFFMAGQHGDGLAAPLTALAFFVGVTSVDILIIQLMRTAQDRLRLEQQRSTALAAENANLLVEAQHRISNNLQMLSSLLSLQRLRDLVDDTVAASNLTDVRVQHAIDIEQLPAEAVVPVGLIVLELVSNALEHSGGRQDLEIRIELSRTNKHYRLLVADNGVGFPHGFDPSTARSLGTRIIAALVGQLHGVLRLDNRNGAVATVVF